MHSIHVQKSFVPNTTSHVDTRTVLDDMTRWTTEQVSFLFRYGNVAKVNKWNAIIPKAFILAIHKQ